MAQQACNFVIQYTTRIFSLTPQNLIDVSSGGCNHVLCARSGIVYWYTRYGIWYIFMLVFQVYGYIFMLLVIHAYLLLFAGADLSTVS